MERGQGGKIRRAVLATVIGGDPSVGSDPERGDHEQVIEEIRFMSKEELEAADGLYPSYLKDELWDILEKEQGTHDPFKVRK